MLIYILCETSKQITGYFYFKLRSLCLHVSVFSRLSLVQNVVYTACVQKNGLDIRERINEPPFP